MPKQILLADDSITIQKVIALTFAGEDYKITAVDNGVDALAKAWELRPDIILADVVMPQKNGYEVSAEIKNDPELKDTPVLLLAGTFEPFDEDEAKRVGADGYIIKPFESQSLIRKVKELIAGREAVIGTAQPQPTVTPPVILPPMAVPVTQPAAVSVPPKAPPAPPIAPRPVKEEDFWGTMMEEVDGKAPEVKPSPVQPPDAAVSGADVWDMGELEEAAPAAAKGEEELWESFAFEDTEVKEEVKEAPLPKEAAPQETTEGELIFETEKVGEAELEEAPEILEEEQIELVEEAAQAGPEEFAFAEEVAETYAVPKVSVEPQSGIVRGHEETFEQEAIAREVPLAPPSGPSPLPIPVTLSEDQLRAALSKVSREIIEKIVWEVVPDMAEILIKEEIKRLQKKQ